MSVLTDHINLSTRGNGDMVDITGAVGRVVDNSSMKNGIVTLFSPSATSALTTIEYEPGLLGDLPDLMEKLIPSDVAYKHDQTWHDGNGFSHLRSALIGPDITIPFVAGKLTLGTWQQVVFLDFDNRRRKRELIVQIMGE